MEAVTKLLDVTRPTEDRSIIKIVVTPAAKSVVTQIADRYGMKEYIVASAVYEWFGRQDDVYQRAVLGMLDGLEVDAARVFMKRLASGEKLHGAVTGDNGETEVEDASADQEKLAPPLSLPPSARPKKRRSGGRASG